MQQPLPIAKSSRALFLLPGLANRHGLITGATGTGKTVSLHVMAEGFGAIGVPVFMADVVMGGGNSRRQSASEAMVISAAREIGSEVGRRIIRGVLGSILGGSRR
jgi:DNA double-strand break repair helicase HerA and related ATPase